MVESSFNFQIIAAIFFLVIAGANAGVMWFKGREQRRENLEFINIQKRVIAWYFVGMTVPFVFLFLGAEIMDIDVFDSLMTGMFGHPLFSIFGVIVLCFDLAFLFYLFFRGGAAELVRLQPMFRAQPAALNSEIMWKCLAVSIIPIQCFALYHLRHSIPHVMS